MPRFKPVYLAIIVLVAALASGSLWWSRAAAGTAPVSVAVTAAVPVFTPRVVLAQPGQPIVFHNSAGQPLRITSTPHNPAAFQLTVGDGGSASLTLHTPGLYHFYDAATAHVTDYAGSSDVVRTLPGAPNPDLPDQGWIVVPGPRGVPLEDHLMVPSSNDLFAPMVGVVRVGGSVIFHNHDTDPHNLVTDPADPTGVAFELLGTDGEPTIGGAERRITFTQPGLYHLYCTIHARIVGRVGGWEVVVPRDSHATGYADHNPMQSWVLVVP